MKEIPQIPFIKSKAPTLEFEIFSLSSLFARHPQLIHPIDKAHRVDFYNILFITEGTGIHYVDFRPYHFNAGSTIFVSKGQVRSFDLQSEYAGFVILFTEAFLSKNIIHSDALSFYRLYNYHLHSPVVSPTQSEANIFSTIVAEIYKEYNEADNFAKEEILQLLLKLLLLKAERIKRTVTVDQKNAEWIMQFGTFQNLLEDHISHTRNAKEYAGMMGISYKHLNEICKSVTGNTAKEVIDNLLVLEGKRHLAVSDISVKELSYKLGFDEPTNFVKYFKKHTQTSPSQFRKSLTV